VESIIVGNTTNKNYEKYPSILVYTVDSLIPV
jgi:hypothetical protein